MTYLFSQNGLKLLESMCFAKTLFAFDFDGTLSAIVSEPQQATISVTTKKLITQLIEKRPVAIISGRGLDDLRTKLSPTNAILVGNHGLEGISLDVNKNDNYRIACEKWNQQIGKKYLNDLPGVEIEDKIYSLAIHYRKSRQKKMAKLQILNFLDKLEPTPRIIMGKFVVNLVPPGAPHKGVALLEIMLKTDVRSAFYLGDDDTDEDVFSLPDPRLFTVRVGQKKSSHAKYYIKNQSEVNLLLKTLISFLNNESQ